MDLEEQTLAIDPVEVTANEPLRLYIVESEDRGYWIPKDVILNESEITASSDVGAVGKLVLPLMWAVEHKILRSRHS